VTRTVEHRPPLEELDQVVAPPRRRVARQRPAHVGLLLLLPAALALTLFFLLPLVQILIRSLTDPEPGLGNYTSLFTDGVTLPILWRTVVVGLVVTAATMLLAYPYTYVMSYASPTMRAVMITIVLVPFWTSMLARNYAWFILMQRDGVIDRAFAAVGIDGVVLLGTTTGVAIVMTGVLLPFMVLPLYSVMSQIDPRVMAAGQNLGASRISSFRQIHLPLARPGLVAGGSLVFILSLGFYITPALIGSPQGSLIAQAMAIRTQRLLDFGGAGAMGILILVVTLVILVVSQRLSGRSAGSLASATGRATEKSATTAGGRS